MRKIYITLLVYFLPFFVFAVSGGGSTGNEGSIDFIIAKAGDWISTLTPIVVALALLYFFWGLANFILKSGEDKEKGKDIMIHGIVALFVMVAVWGLVSLLVVSFLGDGNLPDSLENPPGIDLESGKTI